MSTALERRQRADIKILEREIEEASRYLEEAMAELDRVTQERDIALARLAAAPAPPVRSPGTQDVPAAWDYASGRPIT